MRDAILIQADARALPLPDGCVQTVVSSPPYWRQRDYGCTDQIGTERLHDCLGWATGTRCGECFVCHLVQVGRELARVLRPDGTLWLNLGDTYAAGGNGRGGKHDAARIVYKARSKAVGWRSPPPGLQAKDLVGIPWRVALALQADGWILRQENVWAKPDPLPEGHGDRTTRAHEQVFHLALRRKYYFDADAIAEPALHPEASTARDLARAFSRRRALAPEVRQSAAVPVGTTRLMRRARSVWTVATCKTTFGHGSAMPTGVVRPCVLAGAPEGGLVLDPFCGSGTTGVVALRHGRRFVGCDLNPEYLVMARGRLTAEIERLGLATADAPTERPVQLGLLAEVANA